MKLRLLLSISIILIISACRKEVNERPNFITLGNYDEVTMDRKIIDSTFTNTEFGDVEYAFDFNSDSEPDIVLKYDNHHSGAQLKSQYIKFTLNNSAVLSTVAKDTSIYYSYPVITTITSIEVAQLLEKNFKIKKDTFWFSNQEIDLFYYHFCADCPVGSSTKRGIENIVEKYLPISVTYNNAIHLGWIKLSYDFISNNHWLIIHEFCIQK